MGTLLTNFLIRKDALKKWWERLGLFPGHKKFVYLINDLSVKLKSILLLPHIDWLTKKAECLPKFFWDVILKFG